MDNTTVSKIKSMTARRDLRALKPEYTSLLERATRPYYPNVVRKPLRQSRVEKQEFKERFLQILGASIKGRSCFTLSRKRDYSSGYKSQVMILSVHNHPDCSKLSLNIIPLDKRSSTPFPQLILETLLCSIRLRFSLDSCRTTMNFVGILMFPPL